MTAEGTEAADSFALRCRQSWEKAPSAVASLAQPSPKDEDEYINVLAEQAEEVSGLRSSGKAVWDAFALNPALRTLTCTSPRSFTVRQVKFTALPDGPD